MAQDKPKKPSLSDTALNMLYRCAMQYFYRYVEGLKIPPGIAQLIGRNSLARTALIEG